MITEAAKRSGLQELPGPWFRGLVRDHLSAADNLHLFQSSRGLSATVLQHAAKVWLVLSKLREEGLSSEQLQARAHALSTLLAAAPNAPLHVALRHGIPSAWSIVPKAQVTQLTLAGITITPEILQEQLHLQECSQVHTLTLGDAMEVSPDAANLMQQRALPMPPALTCLCARSSCSNACFFAWQQLLGPQLTHITMWGFHSLHTPSLSNLTHFIWAGMYGLSDRLLDTLATLPALTSVSADHPTLHYNHHNTRFHWGTVDFRGVVLDHLLQLPVRQIDKLSIHGRILSPALEDARVAAVHLATCPCLQLVPHECDKDIKPPFFTLGGKYTAEFVALCGRSLSKAGGLHLQDFSTSCSHVLPGIAQLPAQVTDVRVEQDVSRLSLEGEGQPAATQLTQPEELFWGRFVASLPEHITQVILSYPAESCHLHGLALVSALKASSKHVNTKLCLRTAWKDEAPAALQQVAAQHPQHCCLLNAAG